MSSYLSLFGLISAYRGAVKKFLAKGSFSGLLSGKLRRRPKSWCARRVTPRHLVRDCFGILRKALGVDVQKIGSTRPPAPNSLTCKELQQSTACAAAFPAFFPGSSRPSFFREGLRRCRALRQKLLRYSTGSEKRQPSSLSRRAARRFLTNATAAARATAAPHAKAKKSPERA